MNAYDAVIIYSLGCTAYVSFLLARLIVRETFIKFRKEE